MPDRPTHLVTGANAGIGLEIARGLAASGAHVVLACRDVAKAEAARANLIARQPEASLEILHVDVSSQASIREAARTFASSHSGLEVLVNNAAVVSKTRQETVDGRELVFATNVLGYHLLTHLLRPQLEHATRARVVNVASQMAYGLDLGDVELKERPYTASNAYAQSKQANRMLTWGLARRFVGTRITANAMHPGAVSTPLLDALLPGMRGRPTAKGAETAIWLALSPEVEGVTGRFWTDKREIRCDFRGERLEEELWSICDSLSGIGIGIGIETEAEA